MHMTSKIFRQTVLDSDPGTDSVVCLAYSGRDGQEMTKSEGTVSMTYHNAYPSLLEYLAGNKYSFTMSAPLVTVNRTT